MSRLLLDQGIIEGGNQVVRRLADIAEVFSNRTACDALLRANNPIVYTVSSLDGSSGEGELHCGLGMIMPGRVGDEYFMTKGHLHAWRPAAEYYIGIGGRGIMLIEDPSGSDVRWCDLLPETAVHVPGNAAHRTVNVGDSPLTYLGVYPAEAGHDYTTIAGRNFRQMVVYSPDGPRVIIRKDYR